MLETEDHENGKLKI